MGSLYSLGMCLKFSVAEGCYCMRLEYDRVLMESAALDTENRTVLYLPCHDELNNKMLIFKMSLKD